MLPVGTQEDREKEPRLPALCLPPEITPFCFLTTASSGAVTTEMNATKT